jgi:hypothetical protein
MADRDHALRLLIDAVAADPRGKAGVAARLNVSRPLLARVLSPRDTAGLSQKLAEAVIDHYDVIAVCPGTGEAQPRRECWRLAALAAPTHHPLAMRVWRACQRCPYQVSINHRPSGPGKEKQ